MKFMSPVSAGSSSTPCQLGASHTSLEADGTALFSSDAMHPNMSLSEEHYRPLLEIIKLINMKSFLEEPLKTRIDPYLFVLLAEQELVEGREEQALCLIEAAFSAFDQSSMNDGAPFSG